MYITRGLPVLHCLGGDAHWILVSVFSSCWCTCTMWTPQYATGGHNHVRNGNWKWKWNWVMQVSCTKVMVLTSTWSSGHGEWRQYWETARRVASTVEGVMAVLTRRDWWLLLHWRAAVTAACTSVTTTSFANWNLTAKKLPASSSSGALLCSYFHLRLIIWVHCGTTKFS